MPVQFDVGAVVDSVKTEVSGILGKDIATWRGFSERQLQALAKQAQIIAQGYASGDLDDDDVHFFLDGLEDMTENFALTLRGLVTVTVEKVWNATMKVLLDAVKGAVGGAGKIIPGI
jgi:hypothetical protein